MNQSKTSEEIEQISCLRAGDFSILESATLYNSLMMDPQSDLPAKPLISRNFFLLILFIGLSTFLHWLVLILEIPILQALPFWFFQFEEIPIQRLWIVFALVIMTATTVIAFSSSKILIKIVLLILFGAIIQFSFAFSKGKGLDALRLRMVDQGHSHFAIIAANQPSMLYVARNYDYLIKEGKVPGAYTRSKPPGTVLFYMLTEKFANLPFSDSDPEKRLENIRTFASITWPFVTYLVLIPLFLLARQWFDEDTAFTACLFYLSIPSVNLVTLHTDQTIYPFLVVLPVWLASAAVFKQSYLLAFLTGASFYLAAYFSFGLGTIMLLITVPFLLEMIKGLKNWKSIVQLAGSMGLGAIASDILARILLHYDIYIRYSDAIRHHAIWQDWKSGFGNFLRAGLSASTEFFVYLGIPLVILLFIAIGFALYQVLIRRKVDTMSIFSLALAGTFGILLLFGKTDSETARLWIFIMPFVCLVAARFIHERAWTAQRKVFLIVYILYLELGTTYFTIRHQDFG